MLMNRDKKNTYFMKLFEWFILFIGLPSLILFGYLSLSDRWILFLITGIYLIKTGMFSQFVKQISKKNVYQFILSLSFTLTLVLFYSDDTNRNYLLFSFVLYPFFSVPLQEFFFRYFFYKQYSIYSPVLLRVLNITGFTFYHVIYGNKEAVIFSFLGGILFSEIYIRTKSFLLVWAFHALLGVILFLSGFLNSFTDLFC